MIIIRTNIGSVVEVTVAKLRNLADTDKMLRTCADTTLALMKTRIHEKGLDADNRPIGKYSKGYMVVRTGQFQNNKITKGKNAGKFKKGQAGVFTDKVIMLDKKTGVFSNYEKEGTERPRYNRTSDDTVVASLTRQMENDEKVVPIPGGYGIGFSNPFNFKKSQYVERTYKRQGKIFALSQNEKDVVISIAAKHTTDALS